MNPRYLHSVHPLKRIADFALVLTVLWFLRPASAGDLNPPPGPIAPTQRTPIGASTTPGDADSLFKITLRGSYYLTGNITGVVGKSGVEIAASGVTLDLMGFDLLGVAGSLDGIRVSIAATDIAVFNGSVRNWAQDGVDLSNTTNARLVDLRASGNTAKGIITGVNAVVTGCAANGNGVGGIHVSSGTITNCSANDNTGIGIIASSSVTITNCSAEFNTGVGIYASAACTITNCSAALNTGDGISVGDSCTVRSNTCWANGNGGAGAGIHATNSDNRIEGNNCTDNDRGIDVDVASNFITRNTCSGNLTNWDVAIGNVCLVVNAATNAAAIVGNSGGVAPGSTDPNANFTY